jgi:hypothetical protein
MARRLMPTLFCFGLGYSAEHYVAEFGRRFTRIAGTVRTREKAATIAAAPFGNHAVEAFVFDGSEATPQVTAALTDADALLVSAPPGESGDPVLAQCADVIAGAPNLASIVYLSTVGVYGDHLDGWVDETTPPAPVSDRSRERLAAEQAWSALGARSGKPVAILRLSGIYGPGQNALMQVARGSAKRIDKPGQVFNRIRRVQRHRRRAGAAGRAHRVRRRAARRGAAAQHSVRRSIERHVADGVVVLRREQARAEREVEARAWRAAALSVLRGRPLGAFCRRGTARMSAPLTVT